MQTHPDDPRTSGGKPTLSVVVPVYNGSATLPLLVQRLDPVLASCSGAFELILVDDGSRDASWTAIAELASKHPWVRGFRLARNYGQHNALLCGVRAARHEVVVTMDDDLQNVPEEIPTLLSKLAEGYDVVYGPPVEEQHGFMRDLASRATKLALQNMMGAQNARSVSAFRAFRTRVREAFAHFDGPFVNLDVLLTWGTSSFAAVPVRHDARHAGVSNYTFRKLLTHMLNMVTGFSTLPLQLASWIGFAFTLFGAGVLVFVVGRWLIQGGAVPGFSFLASVIAIFSGAQLFALGIIGEYLARMYQRTMDRPSYAVRCEAPAKDTSGGSGAAL